MPANRDHRAPGHARFSVDLGAAQSCLSRHLAFATLRGTGWHSMLQGTLLLLLLLLLPAACDYTHNLAAVGPISWPRGP